MRLGKVCSFRSVLISIPTVITTTIHFHDNIHMELINKPSNLYLFSSAGFPGSQPVSMDVNNIGFLAESPYMISWKADGTRYLMLIEDRDQVYFIDRDNCIFQVHGMTFPYRKNPAEHLTETLVDGVSSQYGCGVKNYSPCG